MDPAHLRLVDVAVEDQVVHVRDRGDGGTVVEGVRVDDRVTDFHRDVQDEAGHGGPHEGGAPGLVGRRHAVADDLQGFHGGGVLFLGLLEGLGHLLEGLGAHELLVEQVLLAVVVGLGLLEVHLGQADAALGGAQLAHLGDDLELRDDLVLLDRLAGFLVQLGHDAADLGFHVHLVPGLDLARDDGGFGDGAHLGRQFLVLDLLRARTLEQVREGADDHGSHEEDGQDSTEFFHML